jgi:hypothetical protein
MQFLTITTMATAWNSEVMTDTFLTETRYVLAKKRSPHACGGGGGGGGGDSVLVYVT